MNDLKRYFEIGGVLFNEFLYSASTYLECRVSSPMVALHVRLPSFIKLSKENRRTLYIIICNISQIFGYSYLTFSEQIYILFGNFYF